MKQLLCGYLYGLSLEGKIYTFHNSLTMVRNNIHHCIPFRSFVKYPNKKKKGFRENTKFKKYGFTYPIKDNTVYNLPIWKVKEIVQKRKELSFPIVFCQSEKVIAIIDRVSSFYKGTGIKKELVRDVLFVLNDIGVTFSEKNDILCPIFNLVKLISVIDGEIEVVFETKIGKVIFRLGYGFSVFYWVSNKREEVKYKNLTDMAKGLKEIIKLIEEV